MGSRQDLGKGIFVDQVKVENQRMRTCGQKESKGG